MLLDELLLGSLKQQPQTFQYLLPPFPYNIYFFYHWQYKSSDSHGYCVPHRRPSSLLIGVHCIMHTTTTAFMWNYRPDDRNSYDSPGTSSGQSQLSVCCSQELPSSRCPSFSLSISGIGGENKLHSPGVVHGSLFQLVFFPSASHDTRSPIQGNPSL